MSILILVLVFSLMALLLYMVCQPDVGTRVGVFNETRSIGKIEEPSLIKNYFYTAGIDSIVFQTADGRSEHGKCIFLGSELLLIKTDTGETIPNFKLSKEQVQEIEKIKGGRQSEKK